MFGFPGRGMPLGGVPVGPVGPVAPGFGGGMPFGGANRRRRMSMDRQGMGMGGGLPPDFAARMAGVNLGGRGRSRSRGHMFDPTKGRTAQRPQSRDRNRGRAPSLPGGRAPAANNFRRRRSVHFRDGVDYNETFGGPANAHHQLQNYERVKELNKGGMSEAIVLLRGRSDGKLYVEKRIRVDVLQGRRARAELETLKKVRGHPHLNQIIEYKMLHNGLCSMILQFCDGGSLSARVEQQLRNGGTRFNAASVWNIIMGVARGLAYLHDGIADVHKEEARPEGWDPICHLDLKPCNIFISSQGGQNGYPRIILADFGCCVKLSDIQQGREDEHMQECGTPIWYPPEGRANKRGRKTGYGTKTDMYMLGATAHVACKLLQYPDQRMLASGQPCGSRYSGTQLNTAVKMLCQDTYDKRPPARRIARWAAEQVRNTKGR